MRRSLNCKRKEPSSEVLIEKREYGRIIMMIVPGADDIQLYQPTHKLAYNL